MAQTTLPVDNQMSPAQQTARKRLPWARALDENRFFPTLLLVPILIF